MSSTRRGNAGELRVQHDLEDLGYLVAQRRHVGGAGDLLAVPLLEERETGVLVQDSPLLIEVKTDRRGPFSTFGPADRRDLLATADRWHLEALLAWTPNTKIEAPEAPGILFNGIFYIPPTEWPREGKMGW